MKKNISAENEEEGDEFEFEIEFESNPKPDKITWLMQDAVGRRETVKEASKPPVDLYLIF